jgi:C-terminal processing protease CtpA/Prc
MPVITAVAYKPTPDSKAGIRFVANRISYINESSLFASSDLRAGQEIISINDQPADGKSGTEIAAMIASAPNEVKIKVIAEATKPDYEYKRTMPAPEVITAVAYKPTPDSKVGIRFVANRISHVKGGGLFSSSDLRVGQEVVSINDQPVDGKSGTEIAAMIASVPRVVTIKVIAVAVAVATDTSQAPNGAPEGGIW